MNDPVQIINLTDGNVLKIWHDDCAESPREWDNLGRMDCRGGYGDKDGCAKSFNNADEHREQIEKDYDVALILPIYIYKHGGVTINTTGFSCPWDSGQCGFIFVTKEDVCNNWSCDITEEVLEKARKCLLAEVDEYDQFLRGEVYNYSLEDSNGEVIDSLGGLYGRECIIDALPAEYQDEVEKQIRV